MMYRTTKQNTIILFCLDSKTLLKKHEIANKSYAASK